MPEIPGAVIVALGIAAALTVYVLAWRATRGRSMGTRALVRGGLALLLAAPIALVALTSNLQRSSEEVGAPLSQRLEDETREQPYAPMEAFREEEAPLSGMEAQERERPEAEQSRLQAQQEARGQAEEEARRQAEAEAEARRQAEEGARLRAEDSESAADKDVHLRRLEPPPPAANGEPAPGPIVVEPPAGGAGPPLAAAPSPAAPESTLPETRAEPGAVRSASTGAEEAQTEWDVVPVFYGTDRDEEPGPKRVTYNAERGRRLELGRALVTVPKIHEVPQIERPWAIRIPYFDVTIYEEAEDPKKHFTMQEIRKLSKEEFLQLVRERLAGSQRFQDHAIVFVHGYNTAFDNAVYRTAQISYDLKFDGAAFVYSWPSGGAVASYTYDRESAGAAQPYLRQFLDLVVKETGAKTISVIAHSMGNQPLLEVLKDMKSAAPEGVVISQIILAAPDVDADNFANLAQRIEGLAKGVTLYAASNDRALIISRNFWQNPRAGDVTTAGPLIVPGIDSIDVTAASTDAFTLNHSGYAENNVLLQDIGKLILSGLRPPDERLPSLKRVTTDKGDYWRYTAP